MPRPELRVSHAIAVLAVVGVLLALGLALSMRPGTARNTSPITLTALGRRVLVIATHPDDEVLTAGGTIAALVKAGASVRVVIATAGDGYPSAALETTTSTAPSAFLALGERRRRESEAAAAALGLPAADVVRLGYSDGGVALMWESSWDPSRPFVGRDGSRAVPYSWAFRPGAPESGSSLTSDLVAQIEDFRPDTVISPDTREINTDHAGVAAFTLLALDEAGFRGTHLTAIVHFKGFPRPLGYLPAANLAPPQQLLGNGASWLALPLDDAFVRAKAAALNAYASQLDLIAGRYMRAFVRANELYCHRPASTPAVAATDSRPSGDRGTVAVNPRPVVATARPNPMRVLVLRMVRGPQRMWFGIVCASTVDTATVCTLSARIVAQGASHRLDVRVRDGRAYSVHVDDSSITATDVVAQPDGDTMWLSLPLSSFEGADALLVSSGSLVAGYRPSRTPWIEVRP